MVRTPGDSLSSIDAVFAAHGDGAGFFLLLSVLPGGLPLWLERRIGACNRKFYTLCQAGGHRGRCLCFQRWKCYHSSLVNIFHVFSTVLAWTDK